MTRVLRNPWDYTVDLKGLWSDDRIVDDSEAVVWKKWESSGGMSDAGIAREI